jgi:hypothetical protein
MTASMAALRHIENEASVLKTGMTQPSATQDTA